MVSGSWGEWEAEYIGPLHVSFGREWDAGSGTAVHDAFYTAEHTLHSVIDYERKKNPLPFSFDEHFLS